MVRHGGQGNGGGRYVQKYQRSQEGREQEGQECISLCFFLCVVCVWGGGGANVHPCARELVKARGQSWVPFFRPYLPCFWDWVSHWPGTHEASSIGFLASLRNLYVSASQCWDWSKCTPSYPSFLWECSGIEHNPYVCVADTLVTELFS